MRLRGLCAVVLLLLVGCSGVSAAPIADSTTSTSLGTTTTMEAITTTSTAPPSWEGFAAANSESQTLAAMARDPVDVYRDRNDPDPVMTLDATTILGTVTVLGVIGEPENGWVEVMLPVRPNGSTGWVKTDHVSLYVVDGEIVVDLSDRALAYLVDGVEIFSSEVGIGSDLSQTPTGHYFVTDRVRLSDPTSPWGPHALGISARSDTITEFNGGDGIIGIHGTNNPGSIGDNMSLGCVRLPNEMITTLYEMVPLGTRVVINA